MYGKICPHFIEIFCIVIYSILHFKTLTNFLSRTLKTSILFIKLLTPYNVFIHTPLQGIVEAMAMARVAAKTTM